MNKRYLEIYEAVKEDIIKGRYKSGSKLPSKRVMAEGCGVSVITVERAYDLLEEEGYIQPKEKSGYFIIYDSENLYSSVPAKATKIPLIPLGTPSDSHDFSFSIYAKTARRVLSEYVEKVLEKSPGNGTLILRSAISEYLSRSRKMDVDPEQIIIGAGAEYLYGLIVEAFGRKCLYGVESPSYQKIAKVYSAGGATLELLKLSSDGIDSDALWKSNANVLHITPYRSFPSGVTASAGKKREYLKWAISKNAYIVEDDFESEFTPSKKPEETLFSIDSSGHVIYVNTFTRTVSPSIRIAYMVIPASLFDLFKEKTGFYSCPVPTLEQLILSELINNGDFERHINRVRRLNRMK